MNRTALYLSQYRGNFECFLACGGDPAQYDRDLQHDVDNTDDSVLMETLMERVACLDRSDMSSMIMSPSMSVAYSSRIPP